MMKNYIIFDLEWNQSPDGRTNSLECLPFEILEIGAVKMDADFQILSQFHGLITPQVYTQLHYKISQVTHMDMQELRQEGEPFLQVITKFLDWCGLETEIRFCTWGSMDLTELQRNMAYYQMEIPFSLPLYYYDVQKLFAICMGDRKEIVSLDRAVEILQISQEKPFHRALDDAFYTAYVLKTLDKNIWKPYISIDYYRIPKKKGNEIYLTFPTYSKYVSCTFLTKEEVLKDKNVNDMICPKCKRMLRKKIRWFSLNQKQYFCLAVCPEHGFVRGKLRIKKTNADEAYAIKTMKLTDETGAEDIFQKKKEQREKRREKGRSKPTSPPWTASRQASNRKRHKRHRA